MVHSATLESPRESIVIMILRQAGPASDCPWRSRFNPWRAPGSTEFRPMARLLFGFVLFTMVFAQATIIPALNPLTVSPNFVLLLLYVVTSYRGVREGIAWLLVAGIITDVLAMDPFGANGLALLPAVLLVIPTQGRVFRSNILIPIALIVLVTFLHAFVLCAIRGIWPDITIVLQALMHAIIFPFLFFAFRWLD